MEIKPSEIQPNVENELNQKFFDLIDLGARELNQEFQKQTKDASGRALRELNEVINVLEVIDDAFTIDKDEHTVTRSGLVSKVDNSYYGLTFVKTTDLKPKVSENEDYKFNMDKGPIKIFSIQLFKNTVGKIYDQTVENVINIPDYTVRCFVTKVSYKKNEQGKNELKFEEEDGLIFKINSKNFSGSVALSKHYATRDLVDQRPIDFTKNSEKNSGTLISFINQIKSIPSLGK